MPTRAEGLKLTVDTPCTADWDSMAGNEQVRFCEHCEKSVHNLSAMTRKDALRFVRANAEGLCVRFYNGPGGQSLHAPATRLHRITRRASKAAAGAFGAFVALGASVLAQTPAEVRQGRVAVHLAACDTQGRKGSSLTGTVLDPNGALVAGAGVTVRNTETGDVRTAVTNAEGVYRFDSLAPGTYTVEFEAEGFDSKGFERVELQEGVEQRQDSTLALKGAEPAQAETAVEAEAARSAEEAQSPAAESEIKESPSQSGEVRQVRLAVMGGMMMPRPENPLVSAVSAHDTRAAKELIALGVDVNVLDKNTHTTALIEAATNGDAEMISALLAAGADVNMKDGDGDTALTSLGDGSAVEMVRALIRAGAKVNHRNAGGKTPLMAAAQNDSTDVLKALIEAGAKVNAKDKGGRTPLMCAAEIGLVENARTLLEAGADVNAKDAEGATALKLAKQFEADEAAAAAAVETSDAGEASDEAAPAEESEAAAKSDGTEEPEDSEDSSNSDEVDAAKKMIELLVSYGAVE